MAAMEHGSPPGDVALHVAMEDEKARHLAADLERAGALSHGTPLLERAGAL